MHPIALIVLGGLATLWVVGVSTQLDKLKRRVEDLEVDLRLERARINILRDAQEASRERDRQREERQFGVITGAPDLERRPTGPDPTHDTHVAISADLCDRIGHDGDPCSRCGFIPVVNESSITYGYIETGAITGNKYMAGRLP